jgi:hypothetical protein
MIQETSSMSCVVQDSRIILHDFQIRSNLPRDIVMHRVAVHLIYWYVEWDSNGKLDTRNNILVSFPTAAASEASWGVRLVNPILSLRFSVALALAVCTRVARGFRMCWYIASPASTSLVKWYLSENIIPKAAASSMAWHAPWDWWGFVLPSGTWCNN